MNSNKLIKLDKKHILLQIIYYLFMILFLAIQYEKTNYIWFFYMELITAYMVLLTVIRYITFYKKKCDIKTKAVINKPIKQPSSKPTTPLDKEFKKNYSKVNRNYTYKEPIPDKKSAYIESAWDELGKL